MNDCYYQVDPSLHIFVFCAATCMHRTVISPVKRSTFESATLSEALNRPLKSVASLGVLRPLALAPSQGTSPSEHGAYRSDQTHHSYNTRDNAWNATQGPIVTPSGTRLLLLPGRPLHLTNHGLSNRRQQFEW